MANWYYFNKNGEKIGPISVAALKALIGQGLITRETVIENHTGRTAVAGEVRGLTFPEPTLPEPVVGLRKEHRIEPIGDGEVYGVSLSRPATVPPPVIPILSVDVPPDDTDPFSAPPVKSPTVETNPFMTTSTVAENPFTGAPVVDDPFAGEPVSVKPSASPMPESEQTVSYSDGGKAKGLRKSFLVGGIAVVLLLFFIGGSFLLPSTNPLREATRASCTDNTGRIVHALLQYNDAHQSLPPLYSVDKSGKPLHSWRVLILPFLDQETLYKEIRLDEPWNSEYNLQFHGRIPDIYRCPGNKHAKGKAQCCYAVIKNEGLIPDTADKRNRFDLIGIRDGTSNTIAIVEVKEPFCWMDPDADLTLEELTHGVNSPDGRVGSFHSKGCNVAAFDGETKFLTDSTDIRTLRALGCVGDGMIAYFPDEKQTKPITFTAGEQAEIDKFIAEHGNNVKKKNQDGGTLLHAATNKEGNTVILKFLVFKGIDIRAKDKHGRTSLHNAAELDAEMVDFLLSKGADIHAKDIDGQTPLHRAAWNGNVKSAELLVAAGANTGVKDNDGKTPLYVAVEQWDKVKNATWKDYGFNLLKKREAVVEYLSGLK